MNLHDIISFENQFLKIDKSVKKLIPFSEVNSGNISEMDSLVARN